MLLEGSCHCGAVHFRVESETPYPYQACYCSICRKTAGGGGYAINLGANANTLEVEGGENLSVYNARLDDRGEPDEVPASEAERPRLQQARASPVSRWERGTPCPARSRARRWR